MADTTCSDLWSTCDCTCADNPSQTNHETPLNDMEVDNTNLASCCGYTCSRQCTNLGIAAISQLTHGIGKDGTFTSTLRPTRRPFQTAQMKFRGQSGQTSTNDFFSAGQEAARAAYEAGGVNALLAFLAGFEG